MPLSLERFIGKVAVVTGASAGIGQAIAEALVKEGIIVAAVARREERLLEQAKQLSKEKGKLHAFKCDLQNQDEILATFKKITETLGPIYILINNAGLAFATNIIDGNIENWKTIMDTNVIAATICIRESITSMKANNIKGHIINVNSVVGHQVPNLANSSLYPASKFALTALTETLRLEINREQLPIKVTSLSPGVVKTEFSQVKYKGQKAPAPPSPGLESQDLADAALYILSTPEHVNIKEIILSIQGHLI